MPFCGRLRNVPETWPELQRAAEQRFWDGLSLATSSEHCETGAIYLLGYTVEMLLKAAYYREQGVPRHVDTSQARKQARGLVSGYRRNDHDLNYWVNVLEQLRILHKRPLDAATLGAIRLKVAAVEANWDESIRYRAVGPTETELNEVLGSADWLLKHYRNWR